jgi:hypothetical protein
MCAASSGGASEFVVISSVRGMVAKVGEVVLSLVPSGVGVCHANTVAAAAISAAGSANSAAIFSATAAAAGPIGALYLSADGPAQANNLISTLLVGGTHAAIGGAAEASKRSIIAADDG